jgi:phage baseplate assembly protein V
LDTFLNLMKSHASQLDQGWAQPRLATVASVDSATYTARVTVQPEGLLSGWLPMASTWVGNGWGLACPPKPGDQVIVLWQEGDAEQGLIIGRIWCQAVPPPAAPAGEFWLVHASGSYLKLHNDGSIESSAGTWTHHGDLAVTGNISDGHGTLAKLRTDYNGHTHPPSNDAASPTD